MATPRAAPPAIPGAVPDTAPEAAAGAKPTAAVRPDPPVAPQAIPADAAATPAPSAALRAMPAGAAPKAAPGGMAWLVKSEPDAFSWEQQVAHGIEPWTGVRNAQAANNLRAMAVGDLAFFYHSNIGREVVGVVEVVRAAYPDPTDPTGRWVCTDLRALGPMPRPVGLAAMKAEPRLADFGLLRQSRLSVVPVSAAHWAVIAAMGGWTGPGPESQPGPGGPAP